VKFHIHMLLTCRIYLNHDSDCDLFSCKFLVRSFFGVGVECRFNLLCNTGGGLGKCYVVLHRAGGWSKEYDYCIM